MRKGGSETKQGGGKGVFPVGEKGEAARPAEACMASVSNTMQCAVRQGVSLACPHLEVAAARVVARVEVVPLRQPLRFRSRCEVV